MSLPMPLLPTFPAQASNALGTTERFLTIVSLSVGILSALGVFTWRISRMLNHLLDLPEEVREVVKELKDLNKKTDKMTEEATRTRNDMLKWRIEHLENDHGLRPPPDPKRRGRPQR